MFKRIIIGILLVLVLACLVQFVKETVLSDPRRIYAKVMPKYKSLSGQEIKDIVFSPDRDVKMLMRYMNIVPLGKMQLKAEGVSGSRIKLSAEASPASWISVFYRASAKATSLIDNSRFYPEKYTEDLSYGDKRETKEIIYDQKKHLALRENNKYKIPPMTFCPLSAFYYLQLEDFEVQSIHQVKLITKEEVYLLEAKVLEIEDDIIRLEGQVKREDSSSTHGAEFELWISQELRVPLLFKVKTPAGLMIARTI
jgi:hypothetical protein